MLVKEAMKPFKKPLIAAIILFLVYILVAKVIPLVNDIRAQKTPIVSIEASNEEVYHQNTRIKKSDFKVYAIHETGAKSRVDTDQFEISTDKPKQTGKITKVTVTMDRFTCEVKVKNDRKKLASFACGSPELSDVHAVVYSNGELCFEGKGDILIFDEYPWKSYDGSRDNPITSVSFEKEVTPKNLDRFFYGISSMQYVESIPESVESMEEEELLNICKEVGVNATFGVTNVKTYRRECKQMGFVDSSLDDIAESMGEIFTKAETVEKALKPETKSSTKTKTIVKEVNLRHLEDQIFGNKTGISELVEKITPLRDAKANLVAMLYERLCEHLKEKEALNKSECFQMLGLLHKTEEKELFNQSWRIIKPNTKLLFNDRDYIRLKSEAEYYKKVCQLLYEEDVFDD